jgi:hypothetical protein
MRVCGGVCVCGGACAQRAVVVNPFSKSSQACERLPESVVEDIKVRLCSVQPQSPELAGTQPLTPPTPLPPSATTLGGRDALYRYFRSHAGPNNNIYYLKY